MTMLDHDDVVDILTMIAASDDRRTPTEADVAFWLMALTEGRVTSRDDAIAAVVKHSATSAAWIKPVHVIEGVRAIRNARLEQCPPDRDLMAGLDPDMPGAEWARIYRERRTMIADGMPPAELRAIAGGRS